MPLIKLPAGSIKPKGWLRETLVRQRNGLNGNLSQVSLWLKREGNAWLATDGQGKAGWEEVPYWLKGFISLGYALGDAKVLAEARVWIEAALASQRPNGDFGPDQRMQDGTRDFWANMLMLSCLRTHYEGTSDHRVITLMTNFFAYIGTLPDKDYLTGYWQHLRGGDMLSSIYWLYNITGDPTLLKVAEKTHSRTGNWLQRNTLPDWHNVNVAQSFDEPGIYFQQSGQPRHLAAAYENFGTMRRLYGQVPGGMYGSDENARPGQDDPRQAIETCGMVEQMYSDEELLGITGDVFWADHCEEVAFNQLPAAMMPDLRSLRYLTSPNQVTADRQNHAPGFQNHGPMTIMNPLSYRCCQHNHGFGWPYFNEFLWMATQDGGLAATLYSASEVTARVNGGKVTVNQTSNYPFEDRISFRVTPSKSGLRFPLYFRLPQWCSAPRLSVNGSPVNLGQASFAKVSRAWKAGDLVTLDLPMKTKVRKWVSNQNSVSVDYGPLTFSLRINERVVKADSAKTATGESRWQEGVSLARWPSYELFPASAWNVALAHGPGRLADNLKVIRRPWPKSNFPFTATEAPIRIVTQGAVLPEWKLDNTGLVAKLQPSPTRSSQPRRQIELVPMGAARLRITAFPWLEANAPTWAPLPKPLPYSPRASHTFGGDSVTAICDQVSPVNSNDQGIPRHTFWPRKGTTEWYEYSFGKPMEVNGCEVYWFDDGATGGGCRLPASWRVFVKVNGEWVSKAQVHGAKRDQFDSVWWNPTTTTGLRMEVKLQDEYSAGVLEWRVR